MGSTSDMPVMKKAADFLNEMEIPFEINALSAHRTPEMVENFATNAKTNGIRVIIAGAGGAAQDRPRHRIGIDSPVDRVDDQRECRRSYRSSIGIPDPRADRGPLRSDRYHLGQSLAHRTDRIDRVRNRNGADDFDIQRGDPGSSTGPPHRYSDIIDPVRP